MLGIFEYLYIYLTKQRTERAGRGAGFTDTVRAMNYSLL